MRTFMDIIESKEFPQIEKIAEQCNPKIELSGYNVNDETVAIMLANAAVGHSNQLTDEFIERMNRCHRTKTQWDTLKRQERNNVESFFDSFEKGIHRQRLYILVGETGAGKSTLAMNRFPDVITYGCSPANDPNDLMFFLANKDGKGLKPHPSQLNMAIREGHKVLLDEINLLPYESLMFLQSITDEKKSIVVGDEIVPIHPDFRILATMNPPSETDERRPLGDALLGRSVGFVIKLTDDIMAKRLSVSQKWISAVREIHMYVRKSGLTDVRDLNYRDFQKFAEHDFQMQFEYMCSVGDIKNIREFEKITKTQEYDNKLKGIYDELSKCDR